MAKFLQDKPQLKNQYHSDTLLKSYLERHLPPDMLGQIEEDLERLGQRVVDDIQKMGENAENHPPRHIPYDGWGYRKDEIEVHPDWLKLKDVSAREGLVSIGYDRQYEEFSRIYQFAKLYLFTPSSAIFTCPLAMTDGAARLIEVYGDDYLKENAFRRLTSRNPEDFWISGQWMTEKPGGSDVGRTETIARKDGEGYRLFGEKWFTSAMPSEMTMTLARIEDEKGEIIEGSRGLSLFYLEVYNEEGEWNNIEVMRLKEKLGTKALPTAELELKGVPARLVGQAGRGVANISTLFNVTRIYNACSSVSYMRRILAIARDYAYRRKAFGKKLAHHPLHVDILAKMEVQFHGAFLLAFRLAELQGKEETAKASPHERALLRILTPLVKLYTAKQALSVVSEGLECMGGAGYLEDTGIPKYLRDTQVLSIWEGTTNVLSLDVLRAIHKDQALKPLLEHVVAQLETLDQPELVQASEAVQNALIQVREFVKKAREEEPQFWETSARAFAYTLARIYGATLLLEQAQWSLREKGDHRPLTAARWWCKQELAPLFEADEDYRNESRLLGLEEEKVKKS